MSWFSRKKSVAPPPAYTAPTNIATYPIDVQRGLKELEKDIFSRLQGEDEKLQQFGIPVPKLHTPFAYEAKRDSEFCYKDEYNLYGRDITVEIAAPTFRYSPHLLVEVTNERVLFISGDEAIVAHANDLLERDGAKAVISNCGGVWLNRDPYAYHKRLHGSLIILSPIRKPEGNGYHLRYGNFPKQPLPLTERPAVTAVMEQRAGFIHSLLHESLQYVCRASSLSRRDTYSHRIFYEEDLEFLYNFPLPECTSADEICTLKILPTGEIKHAFIKEYLDSLRSVRHPLAFAIINDPQSIYFQISFAVTDGELIERQLANFFPEHAALPHDPTSSAANDANLYIVTARPTLGYDCLKSSADFTVDPYRHLFAFLDSASADTRESFQVSFMPLTDAPLKVITTLIEKERSYKERAQAESQYKPDKSEIQLLENRLKAIERKQPAWLANIKLISSDKSRLECFHSQFLRYYETPALGWELSGVSATTAPHGSADEWFLINTDELASLAHFPGKDIKSDRLETASMKSKLPPELFTTGEVLLGESAARGTTKPVTLPDSVRDRHLYIVGKSGTGKSTLITNIARQDIERGAGVCVIDPHGDLLEMSESPLLNYIPEHRIKDTIYLNAKDTAHPIALNILHSTSDEELALLASNLQTTFKRLSDTWGEKMDNVLRFTLHTLAHTEGATFFDIETLLQDATYRKSVVGKLKDPRLIRFWQTIFPTYRDATLPIITRMGKFLLSPLYGMLSSPKSAVNFSEVIESNKILLVNLGGIGEDDASLLGSLIISELQLAIMKRASIPEHQRKPYYLHVDEFQNFTGSAFAKILSEARKYKLCLTLGHQYIKQLGDEEREAIFGNVGTMIMFAVGDKDAAALKSQIGNFEPDDLLNLPKYHALCRPITKTSDTFNFKTNPPPQSTTNNAAAIIEHTRRHYSGTATTETTVLTLPPNRETPLHERTPELVVPQLGTIKEQILFYLQKANYLTTRQIIDLCFADNKSEGAKKANASAALTTLIKDEQIKELRYEGGKLYYLGRAPNPRPHDVALRSLLVKIMVSDYQINSINFAASLDGLLPDLKVNFAAEGDEVIPTFWEFDAGTERNAELLSKVERYAVYENKALVTFVFATEQRLESFMQALPQTFIRCTTLGAITTLEAPVFRSTSGESQPFFITHQPKVMTSYAGAEPL